MITVASSDQAEVLHARIVFDPSSTTWLENPVRVWEDWTTRRDRQDEKMGGKHDCIVSKDYLYKHTMQCVTTSPSIVIPFLLSWCHGLWRVQWLSQQTLKSRGMTLPREPSLWWLEYVSSHSLPKKWNEGQHRKETSLPQARDDQDFESKDRKVLLKSSYTSNAQTVIDDNRTNDASLKCVLKHIFYFGWKSTQVAVKRTLKELEYSVIIFSRWVLFCM